MKKCRILWIVLGLGMLLTACSRQERWQKQYDLGMQYLTEGNYEEAIVAFATAIEIEPNQALAYVGRGGAYIGSGETDETLTAALADYQKAIELDEQNADAYLGAADVYIRRAEYELAEEILQTGLDKTGDERIQSKLDEIESGNFTDSSGKIRRLSSYDGMGTLIWFHEYTYNPNGTKAAVTSYDGGGRQTGHVNIEYQEDGKERVSYYIKDETGEVQQIKFEYDDKGNTVKTEWYDSEGLEMVFLSTYDSQGNETRSEVYGRDGELEEISVMEYDSSNRRTKDSRYGVDGVLECYIIYSYDDGKDVMESWYDGENQLMSYIIFKYDENGDYRGFDEYDMDDNLVQSVVGEG